MVDNILAIVVDEGCSDIKGRDPVDGIVIVEEPYDNRGYENIRDGKLGAYHTYDEIVEEIEELKDKYSDIMEIYDIGITWEGRPIKAVHITNREMEEEKPSVLYTAQTHAREVISAEVGLGLIHKLVEDYEEDPYIKGLVDHRDIWIVPCVNPDGSMIVAREVAETGDSAWRKNARDNDGDGAVGYGDGVDLNRNYPIGFGIGSSHDPRSQIYSGPEPFSEPETRAIRDLAEKIKPVVSAHLHSFSGLILFPYGYKEEKARDHEIMEKIATNMREKQLYEKYTVEKASDLYVCGGAEDDYLYETYGTFAFTIEIGFGYYGPGTFRMFNPPEDQIPYHVENNLPALLYLVEIGGDPETVLE